MQELKPRLKMVYESVPKNSVVADIGTDHAFLPIALIRGGKASKVIACDINEGPLAIAAKNVKNAGVNNIELRLSDGLEKVNHGEVDVVTIAGMGGDLISEIISKANWLKECRTKLVLQPMSSSDSLRECLNKGGFSVLSEKAVVDSGRIYSVIVAEYTDKIADFNPTKKYIGELDKDYSDAATMYIEQQLSRISECVKNIKGVERRRDLYIEMCEAEKGIKEILKKRR